MNVGPPPVFPLRSRTRTVFENTLQVKVAVKFPATFGLVTPFSDHRQPRCLLHTMKHSPVAEVHDNLEGTPRRLDKWREYPRASVFPAFLTCTFLFQRSLANCLSSCREGITVTRFKRQPDPDHELSFDSDAYPIRVGKNGGENREADGESFNEAFHRN